MPLGELLLFLFQILDLLVLLSQGVGDLLRLFFLLDAHGNDAVDFFRADIKRLSFRIQQGPVDKQLLLDEVAAVGLGRQPGCFIVGDRILGG